MSALIKTNEITDSFVKMLKEHPEIIEGNFKDVERGEYVNRDPARTPWVGVYRTDVDYEPWALGHHANSWKAKITVKLVVQAHGANGPQAEDALEEAVNHVMTAVLSDLTIKNKVGMLNTAHIEYSYDETESKTMDFQWAFITLIYETRTGI